MNTPPKSDLVEEIIEFASTNCEIAKDDSLLSPISLTPKQKKSIYCMIGLYVLTSAGLFYLMKTATLPKYSYLIVFFAWVNGSLFFGAGTISMIRFHRSLYFRRHDLRKTAMGYNVLAFFLIIAVIFIYLLHGVFFEIISKLQ
jgi:hypothetical protein